MEVWKDIKGFEGKYKVSSLGRVLVIDYKRTSKDQLLKQSKTRDGYYKVRLNSKGKDITARVHRLVAEAFIDNPDNKETVNHINGNKEDNTVDNLEWADRHEQLVHAYKHNLKEAQKGSNNCNASFTPEQIREIRKLYKPRSKEYSTVALAKMFGVRDTTIGDVVRRVTYKNIE